MAGGSLGAETQSYCSSGSNPLALPRSIPTWLGRITPTASPHPPIYIYTKFPYTSAGSENRLGLVSGSENRLGLVSGQQNIVIYMVLAFPAPGGAAAG